MNDDIIKRTINMTKIIGKGAQNYITFNPIND